MSCTVTVPTYMFSGGTLRNTLIHSNQASTNGGGLCAVSVSGSEGWNIDGCSFLDNRANYGGGAYLKNSQVDRCFFKNNQAEANFVGWGSGGGVYLDQATVNSSRFEMNQAVSGGGIYGIGGESVSSTINSCLILNNTATGSEWDEGGGGVQAWKCTLNNSTVISNSAPTGGGVSSMGFSEFNNCIIKGNHSDSGPHFTPAWDDPVRNTCSEDGVTHGENGCITTDPLFMNAALSNFRLQDGSPCINRGSDVYIFHDTDVAGNVRQVATVDMGAYERQLIESSLGGPAEGWRDIHLIAEGLSNNVTQASVVFSNLSATARVLAQGEGWIELQIPPSPDPYRPLTVDYVFEHVGTNIWVLSNAYNYAMATRLVYYADASCPDDSGNGQSWATAKKSIQATIGLTRPSDYVLVTNGVYETGATVTPGGALSNRVFITNGIEVRSVNGPQETIIQGTNAMRCVYLSSGILSGFTLTGGSTYTNGIISLDDSGGGVWMTNGCVVSNCVLTGNSAQFAGGAEMNHGGLIVDSVIEGNIAEYNGAAELDEGAVINNCRISGNTGRTVGGGVMLYFGGELNSCLLEGNSTAGDGGAVRMYSGGALNNCTVYGNSGGDGGGVNMYEGGWVRNCVVWSNSTTGTGRDLYSEYGGVIENTCASDGIYPGESGCISSHPQFVDPSSGDFSLQRTSPCINAGDDTYAETGDDLAGGDRRIGTVDMGAYEWQWLLSAATGPAIGSSFRVISGALNGSVTNVIVCGVEAVITAQGANWVEVTLLSSPDMYRSVNGDVLVQSRYADEQVFTNEYTYARGTNLPFYVNASRPTDSGDATSWGTAKQTIQAAVDTAQDGDYVLVTNGTYDVGVATTPGYAVNNRVVIHRAVQVRSVNGPDVTFIKGASGSNGGNDTDSVRCVYMTASNSSLVGFTLMDGYASSAGTAAYDRSGGGLWLTAGCSASNCIIKGCVVDWGFGAGVYFDGGGTVTHSTLSGNTNAWSTGGGAYFEKGGTLTHSFVSGNSADSGGGVYFSAGGTVDNCMLTTNSVGWSGGGGAFFAGGGTLNNCTLIGNTGEWGDGAGAYLAGGGTLLNSIVWSNITGGAVADIYNGAGSVYNTCAANGITHEANGCITNNPRFVDTWKGSYQLPGNSPCVNTGTNLSLSATALGGFARLNGGTVDMGAYEYIAPKTFYADETRPDDLGLATNWMTAKKTIQAAIDLTVRDDIVLVTNGNYRISHEIAIASDITVRSVNGAEVTVIDGEHKTRCVHITQGELSGFTLTHGSSGEGGGVYLNEGGALNRCILTDNRSTRDDGPGGGGVFFFRGGVLNSSVLKHNTTEGSDGAGAYLHEGGELNNCTLSGNSTEWGQGGGVYLDGGSLNNCIVWGNSALIGGDVSLYDGAVRRTCAEKMEDWIGHSYITSNPLFMDAGNDNFRLQQFSPCINLGENVHAIGEFDLDGNARIDDGTVDIGAYEASDSGVDTDGDHLTDWQEEHHYHSSRTNPDSDGDTMNDGDEVIAGTDLLSAASIFKVICTEIAAGEMQFSWSSASDRQYTLQGRTNLTDGVWADLPDCSVFAPSNSVRHSATHGNFFYRLNVQEE